MSCHLRFASIALIIIFHIVFGYQTSHAGDMTASPAGSYDSLTVDRSTPAVPNIVTFRFIDEETGLPSPVRVGIFSQMGTPVLPPSPAHHLFQNRDDQSYFYCSGIISMGMRSGLYTINAAKGFEYYPVAFQTYISRSDQITIVMKRMISMEASGWYAGDTHTHMLHEPVNYQLVPGDLLLAIEAEDLHFANVMDEFENFSGQPYFIDPDRILYFSREYRNPHFGHLSLLGLTDWLFTEGGCWGVEDVACGKTLNAVIASRVHEQPGAIVIATHPFPSIVYNDISEWPGGGIARSMPIDLVDGSIDAIDILCYSHLPPPEGVEDYFQALNAGFHIPASAGSDAGLSKARSYPPGGYRLYAYIDPQSESFSAGSWIEAVRRGRSFITNYPLFESFALADSSIGASISTDSPQLSGFVSVSCAAPIERVDIIGDGRVLDTLFPDAGSDGTSISGPFTVVTDSIRWIIARTTGSHSSWPVISAAGLFAQTNPIYIERTDLPVGFIHAGKRAAAEHFLYRLRQLQGFFDTAGYFPGNSRAVFDSAMTVTTDYYLSLVPDPPTASTLVSPITHSDTTAYPIVTTLTPLFRWRQSFDSDPLDSVVYHLSYGSDSTFISNTTTLILQDTLYTIPADQALENHTRYFWKILTSDQSGLITASIPALSSFFVDLEATGTGGSRPDQQWALDPAYPNPFNPLVTVTYSVPLTEHPYRLDILDVRGRLIRSLTVGARPSGACEVQWDGKDSYGSSVASGVYFIRLSSRSAGITISRKLVLLK